MSCTFEDLEVVMYGVALVSSSEALPVGALSPGQILKVGEIKVLLDEISAAGEISIDHELDCVKVALIAARDRIIT